MTKGGGLSLMEHIWMIEDWEKNIDFNDENRKMGLRLRFDKDIDPEVRRACKEFAAFLRREYFFHYELLYMLKTKLRLLLWMVIEYMEHLHGGKMIMRYHHIFE